MSPDHSAPIRRDIVTWVVIFFAAGLVVLWPGDVSWLIDEPRLIAAAWHANRHAHIALGGLYGNFGIRYGPLPTQIYQLLLLTTQDPFALVVLRGLLCFTADAFALLWLARSLRLPRWFLVGVLAAPYVVAYQRILWDASFAMPAGLLALAAFADFVQTHRKWSLRACLLASLLAPTIHPQALPLSTAILGCLAWRYRAEVWRDRGALAVFAAILLGLEGPYLIEFSAQVLSRLSQPVAGYPGGTSHWASALAPFLGGRLLSGSDYLATLAPNCFPAWVNVVAKCGATAVYPLAWMGILVAAKVAWRVFRRRGSDHRPATGRETVILVTLAGLGLQALLCGVLRIPPAPQYFFGVFALQVLAAALGVDALRRWRLGTILGTTYVVGGTILSLQGAWSVHQHGFAFPLWPTLSSSVAVSRALNSFADQTALTDVRVYEKSPQTLRALRLLLPAPPSVPRSPAGLFITHDPRFPGKPGENTLEELGSVVARPPTARCIDTSPLPVDWVPDRSTW